MHVGNNAFYKNRQGVLRIFARVEPELARRLLMAGPPPDAALRALARDLRIEDRVEWRENPEDEELAESYLGADVLLFPSIYEGFGWPVLEAMNFGLPVVASDSGSLPEVVGTGGSFLPVIDEAGFVEAVEQLLASPALRGDFARRGRDQAQRFDGARFARNIRDAYLQAASGGHA
jgi:glycosyltransferase involved in cell wall biosynthesis